MLLGLHQPLTLSSPFFCAQVVSLKLIAQEMLRSTPAYWGRAIELNVPGSLLLQNLEFQAPVVLYASPNNLGAEAVANELAGPFANLRVCTVRRARRRSSTPAGLNNLLRQVSPKALSRNPTSKNLRRVFGSWLSISNRLSQVSGAQPIGPPQATHFLLYLNQKTFMGEDGIRLANELEAAMAEGLQIKMAHEKDDDRSGCAFSTFFETVTGLSLELMS